MFWKKRNEIERKLNQINEIVKKSFSNVKSDTTHIFQWLNYFYRKSLEQEQIIKQLKLELTYIPNSREEIRKIIEDYYSFDNINAKIRELNYRVDDLSRHLARTQTVDMPQITIEETVKKGLSIIEKRVEMLEARKMSLKEKIMKRLTRNSKEYVKSVILSYIKKYGKISAVQLKDMVVDEQNFCSKSSFYRLLEEIEEEQEVGVIKDGKEKHYLFKTLKNLQ